MNERLEDALVLVLVNAVESVGEAKDFPYPKVVM